MQTVERFQFRFIGPLTLHKSALTFTANLKYQITVKDRNQKVIRQKEHREAKILEMREHHWLRDSVTLQTVSNRRVRESRGPRPDNPT